MYCKYCGAEIPEGEVICPNCGPGGKRPVTPAEELLSPGEYFAAYGTPAAKKRIRTLWKVVLLASIVPSLLLVIAINVIRIKNPGAQVTVGAWMAPFMMCLPSLLLGVMTCLKKTQGWAVAYLVVTLFTGPYCLPGPILVLLMMGPLTREYQDYVRNLRKSV